MISVVSTGSTKTGTTGSGVTLSAPSNIVEGNVLVACIFIQNGDIVPPSGWTKAPGVQSRKPSMYYKVATSGDESATNYTFNFEAGGSPFGPDYHGGVIQQLSGQETPQTIFDSDTGTAASSAGSFSVSTTMDAPNVTGSYVLVGFYGDNNTSPADYSNVAITGGTNPTWTSLIRFEYVLEEEAIEYFYAIYSDTNAITGYGADVTESDNYTGSILIIRPITDANGTHTILQNTATANDSDNTSSTTTTSNQLQMTATAQDATGDAKEPTRWSNEARPSTSWTNKTRP